MGLRFLSHWEVEVMNKVESLSTKPGVRCSSHLGCTEAVTVSIARRDAGESLQTIRADLDRQYSPAEVNAAIRLEVDRLAIAIAAEEALAASLWRQMAVAQ